MAVTTLQELIEEIEEEARETARWIGREQFGPRVLAALRKVRREAFVPAAAASPGVLERAAGDRLGSDHFAAVYRRADD